MSVCLNGLLERVYIMQIPDTRRRAFTQEVQTVRAIYPPIFRRFFDQLEADKWSEESFRKHFMILCKRLRISFVQGLTELLGRESSVAGGRRQGREETLRNDLRRNTYILFRELHGLRLWETVSDLVERKSPGKRQHSLFAKELSSLLHYILGSSDGEKPSPLPSAVIADMANQLAYAARHEVPFQFLIGFLSEVGFENAAVKGRSGTVEKWYGKSKLARKDVISSDKKEAAEKKAKSPKMSVVE